MILEEIAEKTKQRIAAKQQTLPLTELKNRAEAMPADQTFPFERALRKAGLTFICEVKKASPSKGVISESCADNEISNAYEQAGAGAISCLTEPFYFLGKDVYLEEIAKEVSIPVLRKDFTIDAYMIYEAKVMSASAVLLICAILTDRQLKAYIELSHNLGLSALVEAHTREEVERAKQAGARVIGVNNRDLKTFRVDVNTSVLLRSLVPDTCLYVSESGIRSTEDVRVLADNGTDAVLIGETLMRSSDKRQALAELRGI